METTTVLNRALQLRAVDGVRSRLEIDPVSGLAPIDSLAEVDASELCEIGGGRLGAVAVVLDSAADLPRVAHLVHANVRRTDLMVSVDPNTLAILAPGLDPLGGQSLTDRLYSLLSADLPAQVGAAYRSPLSTAGWDLAELSHEARRRAVEVLV